MKNTNLQEAMARSINRRQVVKQRQGRGCMVDPDLAHLVTAAQRDPGYPRQIQEPVNTRKTRAEPSWHAGHHLYR